MAAIRGTRAHPDIDVYFAVVVEIPLWAKSAKLQRQYLSLALESQIRMYETERETYCTARKHPRTERIFEGMERR